MTMTRLVWRRLHRGQDAGFALMSVLFFMLVVSVLGTGIYALSTNFTRDSKNEVMFHDSLAAAEAGVDDYLDRLNADYNYATDVSVAKGGTSTDGNKALKYNGSYCNPAVNGVQVSVGSVGYYCYWIDATHVTSAASSDNQYGTLYLYSRGEVTNGKQSATRTVRIGLRPYGFLDALSTSDYNLVDPSLDAVSGSVAATTQYCVYHAYDSNPYSGGKGPDLSHGCGSLLNYWITGNKFLGPMQSNDEFYLCGTPQFLDHVYSGDPNSTDTPYWVDPFGCSDTPSFAKDGGKIQGNNQVVFPPAATTIKTQDTVIGQSGSGCLYTGPTAIVLNGSKMSVYSPETKSTNSGCLGANVNLPPNGTIYVQDQPSSSSDPNYSSTACSSATFPVLATSVSVTPDLCSQGDAFIQGNTSGQLTVAADNNVYITGNLTYTNINATNPRPVLGLIANNTVEVFHPVSNNSTTCSGHSYYGGYCNYYGTTKFDSAGDVTYTSPLVNPTIDAAMLSIQHSFAVQNFTLGAYELGSVNLDGAVAGKFMDIEGVFGGSGQVSGYGVNYTYDTRFEDGGLVPPNFLDPTATFWHRVSYAECAASAQSCNTANNDLP